MATKTKKKVPAKKVAKKKAPARKAKGPVNKNHDQLSSLMLWFRTGMERVQERLGREIPTLIDDGQPASRMAHVYGALCDMAEITSDALKAVSEATAKLGKQAIPLAFELENITTFTTADGYRVTVSKPFRASIKTDKKAEAFEWLRANGLSDLIQETVNAGTLSAAGKAMIEEKGIDLPEDIFNAAFVPSVSLTRTKSKK